MQSLDYKEDRLVQTIRSSGLGDAAAWRSMNIQLQLRGDSLRRSLPYKQTEWVIIRT
jgi:hypothetical protein